jgi:hypothetical protein
MTWRSDPRDKVSHRLRRALVVVVALVAVTGCASEDPTNQELLDAALLRLADFPPGEGWAVERPSTDDPAQADLDAAIERCEQQFDPTAGAESDDRDSDNFSRGEFIVAGSSASVVPDATARDELFSALDPILDCFGTALGELFTRELGEQVRVSPPYALDVATAAERTAGRAIQFSIEPATLYIDVVAVEQGTTLLYGFFMHQGELSLQDVEEILAPAVERLNDV